MVDNPPIMKYDFGDLSFEEVAQLIKNGNKILGFDPGFVLVLKDISKEFGPCNKCGYGMEVTENMICLVCIE